MQFELLIPFRAQRAQIHARWEALIHAEPVNTPLANPNALVHLIEGSIDEIFSSLATGSTPRTPARKPSAAEERPVCPCGRNPLLVYFVAGQQAMREALVLAQAAAPRLDAVERDTALTEVNLVFSRIARRETESFCAVCQHRNSAAVTASPPGRAMCISGF